MSPKYPMLKANQEKHIRMVFLLVAANLKRSPICPPFSSSSILNESTN